MNYPLELGDAALLFFAPCSSLISASSSSMRSIQLAFLHSTTFYSNQLLF